MGRTSTSLSSHFGAECFSTELLPEQLLWASVLYSAVLLAKSNTSSTKRDEAIEWFTSEQFAFVCELLQLNDAQVREAVLPEISATNVPPIQESYQERGLLAQEVAIAQERNNANWQRESYYWKTKRKKQGIVEEAPTMEMDMNLELGEI